MVEFIRVFVAVKKKNISLFLFRFYKRFRSDCFPFKGLLIPRK